MLAGGLGLSLAVLTVPALAASASASAPASSRIRLAHVAHPRALFDVGIKHTLTNGEEAAAIRAGSTVPEFTSSVVDPQNGKSYKYTMVGSNPEVKGSNNATSIKTQVVPVDLVYSKTLFWDPTIKDSCDSGASALTRVQKSPILNNASWSVGSTKVGTGESLDEFQRTAFWKYTKPSGTNPGFSIHLAQTTLPS